MRLGMTSTSTRSIGKTLTSSRMYGSDEALAQSAKVETEEVETIGKRDRLTQAHFRWPLACMSTPSSFPPRHECRSHRTRRMCR